MRTRLGLALVGLLALAGLTAARPGQPAPELTGGPWINSAPLTLAALRGRVVFVEFWTYG
jgi:ABC-type nitrate/sulfonate/bicarbonate transport system substrate-binding protein